MKTWLFKGLLILAPLLVIAGCTEGQGAGSEADSASSSGQFSVPVVQQKTLDAASSEQKSGSGKVAGIPVKVIKVIDGDTIDVLHEGKVTTVRLLLIDTPETHHPKLGVQPYGPEASAYAHQLMDGKTVDLEVGVNGGRDKYGRLLAYVSVGGKSVEELQLARGLARVAYVIPPNTKYVDQYRTVEAQAKKERLGVWAVQGYARADGYHPEVMKGTQAYSEVRGNTGGPSGGAASTASQTTVSGQFAPDRSGNCSGEIKGNISGRGKIYHMPSDPYYKKTRAEACFKTRQAAAQAGFRAAK